MIPEIHLSITRLHPPLVLHLPPHNPLLHRILLPHIPNLARYQTLAQTQRPKTKAISQLIRRRSINLARHSAGSVAHRLLEPDGSRAPVVRRDVHVEPGEVYAGPNIDGYGTEVGCEIFDSWEKIRGRKMGKEVWGWTYRSA